MMFISKFAYMLHIGTLVIHFQLGFKVLGLVLRSKYTLKIKVSTIIVSVLESNITR